MALTKEKLIDHIADRFNVPAAELQGDALIFSSGLLDSFTMMEIIEYVEREAGIRVGVTDVHLDNLDSIDRIMNFVAKQTAKN